MAINYFNFCMVIMNEWLLLNRAYLFDSKHILTISSVFKNFLNISCGKICFSKEGCVKVQLSRTLCTSILPFFHFSLETRSFITFSKNHIIKLNTNMKYKIIQFKNIWRCVPSLHNESIAARLHKTIE